MPYALVIFSPQLLVIIYGVVTGNPYGVMTYILIINYKQVSPTGLLSDNETVNSFKNSVRSFLSVVNEMNGKSLSVGHSCYSMLNNRVKHSRV